MSTDISLVLYNPTEQQLKELFAHWGTLATEYHCLRVLLSGSRAAHAFADRALTELGVNYSLHSRFDNLGFASGHNLLLAEAFSSGAEHVLIVNPDLRVESGSISNLVMRTEALPGYFLAGPSLIQLDENFNPTGRYDSRGIAWDRSARHYDISHGAPLQTGEPEDSVRRVQGVSGACLLVPRAAYCKLVARYGYFFDDYFLAYREDAELGVRALASGVSSVVLGLRGFGHVRAVRGFKRGKALPDLLGVRNRFLLRWTLSSSRPGSLLSARTRDWVVVIVCLTVERRSLNGLRSAFRIRRDARRRGQGWSDM